MLLAGALLVGGYVSTDLATHSSVAQAAVMNVGFHGQSVGLAVPHLGAWTTSTGVQAYCLEFGNDNPDNDQQQGQVVGSVGGVSGLQLARVNYVLANWGNTTDAVQAAGVQAAVWILMGQVAADGSANDPNMGTVNIFNAGFPYFLNGDAAAVQAAADSYIAAANTNAVVTPAAPTAPASPIFQSTPGNGYQGTVTVPAGYTSLTLTNGVWDATGTATLTLDGSAGAYSWTGVPPTDDRMYTVTVSGQWEVSTWGQGAQVTIHQDVTGTQQILGSAAGAQYTGSAPNITSDPLDTQFSPVIRTQVANQFVRVGEAFTDQVTFTLADGSNPWRALSNGTYVPITAHGTLYGPSNIPFTESTDAPQGVPIAGRATVTNDPANAGGTYDVESDTVATESGYYTWVWEIDFDDQPRYVQDREWIPTDYYFKDRFGQVVETHVTEMQLQIVTEATKQEAYFGDDVADSITVGVTNGAWLYGRDGERVPATLTTTAYFTQTEPTQQATAPSDAVVLATMQTEAGGQGTVVSDAVALTHVNGEGWVTFQTCLDPAAQPEQYRGYFAATCDDFGVPSETVELSAPNVTTQARNVIGLYDYAHDTASVQGVGESSEYELTFELYRANEGDAKECLVENLVFETTDNPVRVTGNGEYVSDSVFLTEEGTYWWVEELRDITSGELIHRGECGLENETTEVVPPTVYTQAKPLVYVPELGHDTAFVGGAISTAEEVRTELSFELFEQTTDEPVCEVENRVFDTKNSPITVTEPGEFESASHLFTQAGTYYWQETLLVIDNETDEVLWEHTGECGAEGETTIAEEPTLAITGARAASAFGLWTVLGLLATGAGLMLSRVRKNAQA